MNNNDDPKRFKIGDMVQVSISAELLGDDPSEDVFLTAGTHGVVAEDYKNHCLVKFEGVDRFVLVSHPYDLLEEVKTE